VASPRLCCDGETEEGNREAACAVEGSTRAERVETALGDGACRESILRGGCAQLSENGEGVAGLKLELRYLGCGSKLQTQVIIDQMSADWLIDALELLRQGGKTNHAKSPTSRSLEILRDLHKSCFLQLEQSFSSEAGRLRHQSFTEVSRVCLKIYTCNLISNFVSATPDLHTFIDLDRILTHSRYFPISAPCLQNVPRPCPRRPSLQHLSHPP